VPELVEEVEPVARANWIVPRPVKVIVLEESEATA